MSFGDCDKLCYHEMKIENEIRNHIKTNYYDKNDKKVQYDSIIRIYINAYNLHFTTAPVYLQLLSKFEFARLNFIQLFQSVSVNTNSFLKKG